MKLVVWAPLVHSMELALGESRLALARDDEGVWSIEVDAARLEAGYGFSLDGGPPLPDPRATWQCEGVHGPSRVADLARLRTRPAPGFRPPPLAAAVLYELHVGTFTPEGTYTAAATRLPHLAALGITHVELMPIATFPGRRGWGYDGVDLYAPFPPYGTPQELADFIDACHAHGLAVLLDVVYNHFGPDGNYWQQYAPYLTDRFHTGWGSAINFDSAGSDHVRRFLIDNALMWLRDYRFDGLRLDAVHAMYSLEAVHFLEDLSAAVRRLGVELDRTLVLIAESDSNDPRLVRSQAQGGYQLDAHWVDDFHHSLHRWFTQESAGYYADFAGLPDLATALRDAYVYQGQYSPFRGRRHGRPPLAVSPQQLVVCSQNHDQIGNRARGERLSMLLTPLQLKAVAALTLLTPFVALLFQGEEWGARTPFLYFTDHQDPDLGAAVSEGRRREFASFAWHGDVPDPQDPATFERSKLDWSELGQPPHADLLAWYRALIRIRRNKPHAASGMPAGVNFDADGPWLTLLHADVLTALNLGPRPLRLALPAGRWRLVLSADGAVDDAELFSPGSTRVFLREDEPSREL
jgi:maltooligosyltrehalose trehalohydrolase